MRSITLSIVIIGLVLIEYGCDQRGPGIPSVTSISTSSIWEIDEHLQEIELEPSKTHWDSFKVKNEFDIIYAMKEIRSMNSCLIADIPPPPLLMFEVDSIHVWNVAEGDSINITEQMELVIGHYQNYRIPISNNDVFRKETSVGMNTYNFAHHFYMKQQPLEGGLYKFHFVYYTTSGEVFEAISERLTVKL
ncbi:MAG: hypothetical protein ACPGTP_03980 [Bacteroidia bacterium]